MSLPAVACLGLSKELVLAIGSVPALELKPLRQVELRQLLCLGHSSCPGAARNVTGHASCRVMEKMQLGQLPHSPAPLLMG